MLLDILFIYWMRFLPPYQRQENCLLRKKMLCTRSRFFNENLAMGTMSHTVAIEILYNELNEQHYHIVNT